MKKLIVLTVATSLMLVTSCNKNEENFGKHNQRNDCNLTQASPTVNETEIELIKHMREEEKLARDVYKYMYEKYRVPVFGNIMQSEQTHMDKILCLCTYYSIPDPASNEYGVFTNPTLQTLYNQLIAQGNQSLTEALKVGATIEDVDIKDLMDYMDDTSNPAILTIFDNLTCGSRNHMRSFVSNINANSGTYTPQFISETLYNSIINSSNERCGQN